MCFAAKIKRASPDPEFYSMRKFARDVITMMARKATTDRDSASPHG
jgi:hypothetical protein